jgi:hypothetical protein
MCARRRDLRFVVLAMLTVAGCHKSHGPPQPGDSIGSPRVEITEPTRLYECSSTEPQITLQGILGTGGIAWSGSFPFCSVSASVHWTNFTTAATGTAPLSLHFKCEWLFSNCSLDWISWWAVVPLVAGENRIQIESTNTRTDSHGYDEILVTCTAQSMPAAAPGTLLLVWDDSGRVHHERVFWIEPPLLARD